MVVVVKNEVVIEDKEYDTIVVIGVLVGSGTGK
jgi:hypothetical protein